MTQDAFMFTLVQEDDEAKQVKAEQVMRERWGWRWWTRAGGGICDLGPKVGGLQGVLA